MYDGREIPGRIIPGPLSAALSGYLSQQVRLFHALARLRGKNDITFGVWCEVIQPGRIRVGDPVTAP